ncbi:MAG: hypothetical protein EOO88_44990 [Pedobacter sp.]|nr:MAG: hypothetical protein EOO88_44990 [Pedobacter sp.]
MFNFFDLPADSLLNQQDEIVHLHLVQWRRLSPNNEGDFKVFIHGLNSDGQIKLENYQVSAMQFLTINSVSVLESLTKGLFKKLPALKSMYGNRISGIKKPSDFVDLLEVSCIHLMDIQSDGFGFIGFEMEPDWDEEHGLGVTMLKMKVVKVGQAEAAFDYEPKRSWWKVF